MRPSSCADKELLVSEWSNNQRWPDKDASVIDDVIKEGYDDDDDDVYNLHFLHFITF